MIPQDIPKASARVSVDTGIDDVKKVKLEPPSFQKFLIAVTAFWFCYCLLFCCIAFYSERQLALEPIAPTWGQNHRHNVVNPLLWYSMV